MSGTKEALKDYRELPQLQKEQNCSKALWNEEQNTGAIAQRKGTKNPAKKSSQTENRKTEEMLSQCIITSEYREHVGAVYAALQ